MKTFLVGWLLLCAPSIGLACDVCGIYLGVQPNDRTSSFTLQWRYRRLAGTLAPSTSMAVLPKHGGHDVTGAPIAGDTYYRELYQVLELRADLWLADRFALLVSIPAVNNYRALNGVINNDVYGLGDPLFIGRYQLVNTKGLTGDERTVHRLMVGAGAKLPIGRSDVFHEGMLVDMDQQPGTGTWDGLVSAEYRVRRGRNGAGITAIGRYNGTSDRGYQMGHGLSTTAELFRRWDFSDDLKFMPSLGLYHELSGKDVQEGNSLRGTGSSTLFTHVGSRMWWRSWGLSATFQYAIVRKLGELMVPNRERIVLGISYNLVNT